MRSERWWSVILSLGLFMVLSPLSAQAGPNGSFGPQGNRQAFTPPQARGPAHVWNRQPHHYQQPRGHAYGWNGHNRHWNQPRGHAYGWNGHNRQQHHPQGHAYGWNGHNNQRHQPQGHAYGWNGHQPNQGNQHRNVYGRNDHQWQQPGNWGQHNNPGSAYNHAGHPAQPATPNITPNPSGYSHDTPRPAGHTGERPSYRHPDASGNTPQSHGQSPSGVI